MNSSFLVLLALSALPQADVSLIDGGAHQGVLSAWAGDHVELAVGDETVSVPTAAILEMQFPDAARVDPLTPLRSSEVRLTDGSLIYCKNVSVMQRTAHIESVAAGQFELPLKQVRSLRLAEIDEKVRDRWLELIARDTRGELLVVRNGDALDFVPAVVGDIKADAIQVLVNDRDVELPRQRVFGIVFPNAAASPVNSTCQLSLDSGDEIQLAGVSLDGESLEAQLAGGAAVTIPVARVRAAGFGRDRMRYLTSLQETAAYEPVGVITSEVTQQVRKNQNSLGGTLKVGRTNYARGLWIHSGTTLRYRLNREYRELRAVMGLDRSAEKCAAFQPSVHVVITGDTDVLVDAVVAWNDDPVDLVLDVDGVRDLTIRVTPAREMTLGACEHLVLADPRVIK